MARVDLSDYGYVNARVRGMRSHLLTRDFFMRLVETETFEALHSMMEQTVYRREINEAVLMNPERPDYDQALNVNLVASLKKILDSTGGEPRRLVGLIYTKYDLQNIKTILRGKRGNATPREMINTLIPVGSLGMEVLEPLARESEIYSIIELMDTFHIKYARPLARAFPEYMRKDKDLAILELALDRFHYQDARDALKGKDRNVEMVRRMFTAEIDMRNISTIVRIRGLRLDDDEVTALWIPGGSLSPEEYLSLVRLGDIVRIVGEYPDPAYRKVLERALVQFEEFDLAAFDKELERELIRQGAAMSNVDVLGIGVIIGYLWSKHNELVNLRIVLKGKTIEQPREEMTRALFFVGGEVSEAA